MVAPPGQFIILRAFNVPQEIPLGYVLDLLSVTKYSSSSVPDLVRAKGSRSELTKVNNSVWIFKRSFSRVDQSHGYRRNISHRATYLSKVLFPANKNYV